MNEETEKKSFYEKYLFFILYTIGLIITASFTLTPGSIEKAGLVSTLVVTLGMALPVGFFIYIQIMFLVLSVSFLFDGVKEKNLSIFFTGMYLLGALLYYAYLA